MWCTTDLEDVAHLFFPLKLQDEHSARLDEEEKALEDALKVWTVG